MESNEIVSKFIAEYDRLAAATKNIGTHGDIDFWDGCEESTSTMLVELNELLKVASPSAEFKSTFKKIHDLNSLAAEHIASCEHHQRAAK